MAWACSSRVHRHNTITHLYTFSGIPSTVGVARARPSRRARDATIEHAHPLLLRVFAAGFAFFSFAAGLRPP